MLGIGGAGFSAVPTLAQRGKLASPRRQLGGTLWHPGGNSKARYQNAADRAGASEMRRRPNKHAWNYALRQRDRA